MINFTETFWHSATPFSNRSTKRSVYSWGLLGTTNLVRRATHKLMCRLQLKAWEFRLFRPVH